MAACDLTLAWLNIKVEEFEFRNPKFQRADKAH